MGRHSYAFGVSRRHSGPTSSTPCDLACPRRDKTDRLWEKTASVEEENWSETASRPRPYKPEGFSCRQVIAEGDQMPMRRSSDPISTLNTSGVSDHRVGGDPGEATPCLEPVPTAWLREHRHRSPLRASPPDATHSLSGCPGFRRLGLVHRALGPFGHPAQFARVLLLTHGVPLRVPAYTSRQSPHMC